jgi:hypothetical protein
MEAFTPGICETYRLLCMFFYHFRSPNCIDFILTHPELCPCTQEFPIDAVDNDVPSDTLTFEYDGRRMRQAGVRNE